MVQPQSYRRSRNLQGQADRCGRWLWAYSGANEMPPVYATIDISNPTLARRHAYLGASEID